MLLLLLLLLMFLLQQYTICGTNVAGVAFAASIVVAGVVACVVDCFKATGIWRIATSTIAKSQMESTSRELLLLLKGQGLHEIFLLK